MLSLHSDKNQFKFVVYFFYLTANKIYGCHHWQRLITSKPLSFVIFYNDSIKIKRFPTTKPAHQIMKKVGAAIFLTAISSSLLVRVSYF